MSAEFFEHLARLLEHEAGALAESPRRVRLEYEAQAWRSEARLIRIREETTERKSNVLPIRNPRRR